MTLSEVSRAITLLNEAKALLNGILVEYINKQLVCIADNEAYDRVAVRDTDTAEQKEQKQIIFNNIVKHASRARVILYVDCALFNNNTLLADKYVEHIKLGRLSLSDLSTNDACLISAKWKAFLDKHPELCPLEYVEYQKRLENEKKIHEHAAEKEAKEKELLEKTASIEALNAKVAELTKANEQLTSKLQAADDGLKKCAQALAALNEYQFGKIEPGQNEIVLTNKTIQ